ncbi:MAG TPA: immunity 22 family protein [Spirochaetota bacterium]|nr:immunity 22 family protein [Spirochaetota bacterium]
MKKIVGAGVYVMPMEKSHIWLGLFPGKDEFDAFFEEQYEDDEKPVNAFAGSQGERFYDADWLERSFKDNVDMRALIEGHSYSSDYIDLVIEKAGIMGIARANAFVIADTGEIDSPRSVDLADRKLWYIGVFACRV